LAGGELLINMTGEGTLGRSSVVPPLEDDFLVPSVDVYALDLDEAEVMPGFVAVFLNTALGRALSTSLQTGSSGQQHLYPAHFSHVLVPMPRTSDGRPDLELQSRVVELADTQARAMAIGRAAGQQLDGYFEDLLGMRPDLGIIPK
jgi:hypothetical protein